MFDDMVISKIHCDNISESAKNLKAIFSGCTDIEKLPFILKSNKDDISTDIQNIKNSLAELEYIINL